MAYNQAVAFIKGDGSRTVPIHLRNAPTKRLGLAPLLIHVVREEISRLTCMHNDVRLCHGTAIRLADLAGLELLEILADEHADLGRLMGYLISSSKNDYSPTFK
jgi:hypothetical protein